MLLLQVSSAAPVAAALASGTASDATLNRMYGGSAAEGVSELSMAIPVYEAIGKVRLTSDVVSDTGCSVLTMKQSDSVSSSWQYTFRVVMDGV